MEASKLTDAERSELQILHEKGYPARDTAAVLRRSPNTVANEFKQYIEVRTFCYGLLGLRANALEVGGQV